MSLCSSRKARHACTLTAADARSAAPSGCGAGAARTSARHSRVIPGSLGVMAALLLAACGGSSTPPAPTQSEVIVPSNRPCALVAAAPASGATNVLTNIEPSIIQTGPMAGACGIRLTDADGTPIPTRPLVTSETAHPDGGMVGTQTLQPLSELAAAKGYSVWRGDERLFSFMTGSDRAGQPVSVTDRAATLKGLPNAVVIQPSQINDLLKVLSLDLADGKEVVAALIDEVLSLELPKFAHPDARYAARIQAMTYTSALPDGQQVTLSGLMVLPVAPDGTAPDYSAMPVLISQHGAQSSSSAAPSSAGQSQLLVALLGAGKGHIVIAPDLIGIGDTAQREQAYLVSKDTGAQTRDMLLALRTHLRQQYGATPSQELRIVGSSQGGHSVMAALPYLTPVAQVKLVNTLAGPFDVDRTFNGALLALAGEARDAYATHENLDLAPQRLKSTLDALKAYQRFDYDPSQVFDATGGIQAGFLADYKAGRFNHLRGHWRVNSMASTSQRYDAPDAKVVMYHFGTDALVPAQNTADMLARLRSGSSALGSVSQGDCREKSPLSTLVLKLSNSPLKTHTVCAAYQYNDLVADL